MYRLSKLSVEGDMVAARRVYLDLIRTKPGAIFDRKTMMEDLERIRAYQRAQGREDVTVEPETTLDADNHRVDVVLRITKGGS